MQVSEAITKRRTEKVLADPANPLEVHTQIKEQLRAILQQASCAPFHKPADPKHRSGELDSVVPWRFYVYDTVQCRKLISRLSTIDAPVGKIPNMLAAAESLVVTTWLPDSSSEFSGFNQFEPTLKNMEHIAAASAAIQNVLLLATDVGLKSYWSSGGVLRNEQVFEWSGIEPNQILLGAIFLFPDDCGNAEIKPGKMRDQKGELDQWTSWVSLD